METSYVELTPTKDIDDEEALVIGIAAATGLKGLSSFFEMQNPDSRDHALQGMELSQLAVKYGSRPGDRRPMSVANLTS